MFSIKCAGNFPSFFCVTRAELLILCTKIKWESVPWNGLNVLCLSHIYLDMVIIMQCLILLVQSNNSAAKWKGRGMCYPVAIVREVTFSSTVVQMMIVEINDLCLMFYYSTQHKLVECEGHHDDTSVLSKISFESKFIHFIFH